MCARRVLLILAVLIACARASAQPQPASAEAAGGEIAPESLDPKAEQARALFLEGIDLARQERWDDAAGAFKRSRELADRASTAFNHGSTLYRLGRFVEAQSAFEAYQRMAAADDPSQAEGMRLSNVLAAAIPTVALELAPAHALVQVDGRDRSETGAHRTLTLDPGVHKLLVSAENYRSRELLIDLAEGARATQVIQLERVPTPAPPQALFSTRDRKRDDGGSVLASPWFWLVTAAVIGGGVAATVLLTQKDHVGAADKGTTGVLLVSLSAD